MSNSTRQGGYDERLVVPLEASRRGAHRARANRVVAVLPILAVVVVVAAVIGVAYTLFLKPSRTSDSGTQSLPTVSSPPAASAPAGTTPKATTGSAGAGSSASPSAGATATVDKTAAFQLFNGSVHRVKGLAARANQALKGTGWTGGQVETTGLPVSASQTTRIYYAKSSQQATAEAIQKALKVGVVNRSATLAAQGIVVVIGDDYSS